jgi:hypothetical protein
MKLCLRNELLYTMITRKHINLERIQSPFFLHVFVKHCHIFILFIARMYFIFYL